MKRKTKDEVKINYIIRAIEVSFEEVDLDIPQFSISSIATGKNLFHTVTACCTEGISVEALINGKRPVTTCIRYKKNISHGHLISLIDDLQREKDNLKQDCDGK